MTHLEIVDSYAKDIECYLHKGLVEGQANGSFGEDLMEHFKIMTNCFKEMVSLEDELGIDLVTLFKALKQGHIWVKKKGKVISSCDYNLGLTGTTYDLYCKDVGEWLLVKEYGKTWALAKEELE